MPLGLNATWNGTKKILHRRISVNLAALLGRRLDQPQKGVSSDVLSGIRPGGRWKCLLKD